MKKLTKSATDVKIAGVCGGIAEYLEVDPTIIRILFLIITFAGIGSPLLFYLLLAIIMPEAR